MFMSNLSLLKISGILLILTAFIAGIQSYRVNKMQDRIEGLKEQITSYKIAQKTLLETIEALEAANKNWAMASRVTEERVSAMHKQLLKVKQEADVKINLARKEREVIYDQDPDVRIWANTRVPAAIIDRLRSDSNHRNSQR